jgi:bifunctional DNA-binding transcriptional regulator/antitoxin component of YhaV-PrlF toxin-antitoxin module
MPTLTLRKLIKFGEGGLVITVPKGWIRYYGLKPGQRLEVIANGELTVRPEKGITKPKNVQPK